MLQGVIMKQIFMVASYWFLSALCFRTVFVFWEVFLYNGLHRFLQKAIAVGHRKSPLGKIGTRGCTGETNQTMNYTYCCKRQALIKASKFAHFNQPTPRKIICALPFTFL